MEANSQRLTFAENKFQIEIALKYARSMVRYKYAMWKPSMGFPNEDNAPFWKLNNPVPSKKILKKKGMCCTGLVNLVRRKMKLKVPGGRSKHAGTTSAWFNYLKYKKRLQKINFNKSYPKGTLLVQNFNPKDQGHVGIVLTTSKKDITFSKFIHAISDRINNIKYNSVTIEKVKNYPRYKRFTHICLPEDWILKN